MNGITYVIKKQWKRCVAHQAGYPSHAIIRRISSETRKPEKGLLSLINGANNGNILDCEELAFCYDSGNGVRKSYVKAFYWYMVASAGGNPIVEYNIGLMYLLGHGVRKNKSKSFRWTRMSAMRAYPDAMLALAWHYYNGIGTRKNIKYAIKYYKKCIGTDCTISALFSLGEIYYNQANRQKMAFKYFIGAANAGHAKACYYIGRMYLYGKGTKYSLIDAKRFLARASDKGVYQAQRLLHHTDKCRGR